MVSLPVLTDEDVEVLKDAFTGDNVTSSIVKALCSSKSPADMHQVGRPKVVYLPNRNEMNAVPRTTYYSENNQFSKFEHFKVSWTSLRNTK